MAVRDAVRDLLTAYAAVVRSQEGTVPFEPSAAVVQPNEFVVFKRYRDESASRAHVGSAENTAFNERLAPLIRLRCGLAVTPATRDALTLVVSRQQGRQLSSSDAQRVLAAARHRVLDEAEAMWLVAESLEDTFVPAVRYIQCCSGTLVTKGVGTSAPVA